jgi:outer membrane protein TolC
VKNLIEITFLNILKLQRTKQILEQNATVFQSRKTDATNFFKNGTGLENDVLKTDLALLQIKTTQKDVENFIKATKYNLVVLLSLPDDTNLTLDEKNAVADPLTVSDLNAYVKMVDARPEIAAAGYRKQASESLLEVAKGNYFPTVRVFVNSDPNLRVFPQVDQFKATWELGLTLNYNITNLFTNKYQVSEAKANIYVAQNQRNGLVNMAKTEVSNAFYALQSANDKLELYKQAVTQSTENARVIKNRYNSQISTVTESLDADFEALQAKINLENAVLDSEIARRKLLKTVAR